MGINFWAISPMALIRYRQLEKQFKDISAAQIETYIKKIKSQSSIDLTIIDGMAVIEIRGVLGNKPTFEGFFFGTNSNTYSDIIQQLSLANSNPDVKLIQLRVDSPGGHIDGLFTLLDAIKATPKPIEAVIENRADSAAYGIVSQADKIIAESDMSEVGSVGVAVSIFVDSEIVDITSSDAPKKWPDVTTAEGVAIEKAELDELHKKFAAIIAEGRSAATGKSITVDTVNTNFGQGGTMLANAGLAADMLDEVKASPARVSNASFFENAGLSTSKRRSDKNKINKKMDLSTLKKEHPDIFEQARKDGVASERERISALLKMGKNCGKLDYAIVCVEGGKCITQPTVQAEFLSAQKNMADVNDREKDDPMPIDTPSGNEDKEAEAVLTKAYMKRRKERGIR